MQDREGQEQRLALRAVRQVGGPHELLGRDAGEQGVEVDRAPAGAVEDDVGHPGDALGDAVLVDDRGVREDQERVGIAGRLGGELLADRGHAAPGVDQDRDAVLRRHPEDRVEAVVVELEGLGARVQLDAARAGRERALGLGGGVAVEAEPAEGDHAPAGGRAPLEHAVVGDAVVLAAVGIVEREGRRRRHPGRVHVAEQLLERLRHPVLVEAEVRVRVDAGGAAAELLDQGVHARDLARDVGGEVHGGSLRGPRRPARRAAPRGRRAGRPRRAPRGRAGRCARRRAAGPRR